MSLMNYLSTIVTWAENATSSLSQILILFATSIFVRTFFENFTNSNNAGFLNSLTDTFLHYPLWYAMVFLSIIIIVYALTQEKLVKIGSLIALGSFIILLPPIIDMIAYGFLGHPYNFIAGNYATLWEHFSSFMFSTNAIGIGIKIEIIIATIGIGSYVYLKTRHFWKSVGGALLSYTAIFIFLTLPVHTMALFNVVQGITTPPTPQNVVVFYTPNNLEISEQPVALDILNKDNSSQQYFSQKISIVFSLILVFLLGLLVGIKNKEKFLAIIKNVRPMRLFHWFALTGIGLYVGYTTNGGAVLFDIYFLLNLLVVFASIAMAWLFSVWDNDEEDIAIDTVSNSTRPLVNGIFSIKEWRATKNVFLFFALLLSWLAGYPIFIVILLFILAYHHYSRKPLRLKRILVISSLIVPFNATLVFLAGFFTLYPTTNLAELPFAILGGIFVIYFLIENIKNMKDIEGDRREGIRTLPVLLGKYAGVGMSVLLVTASVIGGLFFYPSLDITLGGLVMLGITIYFLNKKPYREAPIFILYCIFLVIVLVRIWIL